MAPIDDAFYVSRETSADTAQDRRQESSVKLHDEHGTPLPKFEIIPANSLIFKMQINAPTFTKKVKTSSVVDSNKAVSASDLSVSKKMIPKRYLDSITQLDGRQRADISRLGMRTEYLGKGSLLIPVGVVLRLTNMLDMYRETRQRLIDSFIEKYEQAKEDFKKSSPELYKEHEYPTAEDVRRAFSFSYHFFNVNVPSILESVSESVFKNEQSKLQKELEEALDEIKQGLRAGFLELVANLEDKVRGLGTERKRFTKGFVTEFKTFLETFDAKNISNDAELKALVDRCKGILDGVSPDNIRNSIETQIKLEKELGAVREELEQHVEAPKRQARFARQTS